MISKTTGGVSAPSCILRVSAYEEERENADKYHDAGDSGSETAGSHPSANYLALQRPRYQTYYLYYRKKSSLFYAFLFSVFYAANN